MNEDITAIEESTKRERIEKIYNKYKKLIYIFIFTILTLSISIYFYIDFKKKTKQKLSDQYIQATILLKSGENEKIEKAKNSLTKIILSNDSTYSTLALFLIINQNLIKDKSEVESLFNQVINNNNFDEEIKNLLIFKKALTISEFVDENKILQTLNPIINSDSIWKPHALMLLGDYFFYKNNFIKAKEFYNNLLLVKNINQELYQRAVSQLGIISGD